MSTPTPRTKPIDLSKCKVGQRVKLRNGKTAVFKGLEKPVRDTPPYIFSHEGNPDLFYYTGKGKFWLNEESMSDIVATLPLPKKAGKKASGMPAEKPMKMTKRERELHNREIKNVIKLLKGLLKP